MDKAYYSSNRPVRFIYLKGYAGHYKISNNAGLICKTKPSILGRLMARILNGWKWVDNE